jgi:peptide-methionine (R)-S-oxide reductase
MTAPDKIAKTHAGCRAALTPEQLYVTRQRGTEPAGTLPLDAEKRPGIYTWVCCGEPLFASTAKFNSGRGRRSSHKLSDGAAATEHEGGSLFMRCTQARWARCEAPLGHVLQDCPRDASGFGYCSNGAALKSKPDDT